MFAFIPFAPPHPEQGLVRLWQNRGEKYLNNRPKGAQGGEQVDLF